MPEAPLLTIGEMADRTGCAVSAIRFYTDQGLIDAERAASGHRRYRRATVRRVSFILISQKLGYSLSQIRTHLDTLPSGRAPTESDWQRLARSFATDIDDRVTQLLLLREKLDGCIGCGCLSLTHCAIYNVDDAAKAHGPGPRYLLGDAPLTG